MMVFWGMGREMEMVGEGIGVGIVVGVDFG